LDESNEIYYEELYSKYEDTVYSAIKGMLYSKMGDDISSCVQDTFLIAWKNMDKLRKHENVAGWLVVTAKNVARKFNKKYLEEQKRIDNSIEMDNIVQENDFTQEIADEMVYQEYLDSGMVEKFMNDLTEDERKLYDLKRNQKLKNGEIAKILGITPNAVILRYKRLVEKFKKDYLYAGAKKKKK